MSKGLIGIKVGMTSIFDEASGGQYPCTVVEVEPNVVTQIRTEEKDGYTAVQLGIVDKKEKRTSKAMRGHFESAGVAPKRHIREFEIADDTELSAGDEVSLTDVFEEGETIDVTGTSKGKGFQGVVKRHGFAGVNDATHGQHNRQRAPGSIGAGSDPSRVQGHAHGRPYRKRSCHGQEPPGSAHHGRAECHPDQRCDSRAKEWPR